MAKYSAELKLCLVQAYESHQLSALEIREQFGVSARMLLNWYQQQHRLSGHETVAVFNIRGGSGVVSHWRQQYDLGGRRALEPKPKGRPAKMPPTNSLGSKKNWLLPSRLSNGASKN